MEKPTLARVHYAFVIKLPAFGRVHTDRDRPDRGHGTQQAVFVALFDAMEAADGSTGVARREATLVVAALVLVGALCVDLAPLLADDVVHRRVHQPTLAPMAAAWIQGLRVFVLDAVDQVLFGELDELAGRLGVGALDGDDGREGPNMSHMFLGSGRG